MVHFSVGNYIANLFWSFTIYVLPIMVLNLLEAKANAYFFIAWTIGGVLGTVSLATTTALFAEGSFDEKRLASDIWRCLKITLIILIPPVIIVGVFADKILLLYGNEYSIEGASLLRMMALAALPLSINNIYFSVLRIKRKMKILILLAVLIAAVTLSLSYTLLPRVGIIGPGIGWLVSQGIVAAGIVIIFLLRRYRINRRLNT